MRKTIDILKYLGERKNNKILVGFAVETDSLEEYAKQKLMKKNLDMIVANKAEVMGSDQKQRYHSTKANGNCKKEVGPE